MSERHNDGIIVKILHENLKGLVEIFARLLIAKSENTL